MAKRIAGVFAQTILNPAWRAPVKSIETGARVPAAAPFIEGIA
ncbi:hypothetical protein ABC383_20895 [Noviherbaspirillum sp. 1P10PC]